MKIVHFVGFGALVSMLAGCAAQAEPASGRQGEQTSDVTGQPNDPPPAPCPAPSPTPTPSPTCSPLAQSNGSANPAAVYCVELGYTNANEQCTFPDGTSCEEWSFYRGECGQAHSFCNLHGGSLSSETKDMGGWTGTFAICTFPSGASCEEDTFAHTCDCK